MRRLVRRTVGATICRAFGHGWLPPIAQTTAQPGNVVIYMTKCHRCKTTLTGTWSDMERAGAWQHYRRSL